MHDACTVHYVEQTAGNLTTALRGERSPYVRRICGQGGAGERGSTTDAELIMLVIPPAVPTAPDVKFRGNLLTSARSDFPIGPLCAGPAALILPRSTGWLWRWAVFRAAINEQIANQ